MPSSLEIKAVTDLREFRSLEEAWNRLAELDREQVAFHSHDWFDLWMRHFLKDDKLLILLACQNGEIRAIAPFLLKRDKFKGVPVRKIELIGNAYSPHRAFLLGSSGTQEKTEVLLRIFQYLFREWRDWDVIDLCPLAEDQENYLLLKKMVAENGWPYAEETCGENWYVDGIDCSFKEYFEKRSSNFKHNLRQRKKKLLSLGDLEFRMVQNGIDVNGHMDIYYDVYERSWKKKEGIGPTFHRDLARIAAEKGWLRLGFLTSNGNPLSTHFGLICGGTAYLLKVAYDEEFGKFGPGNLMHYKTIEHLIDVDQVKLIDFGLGSEEYKKNWASQRRLLQRLYIFNRNWRGISLAVLHNRIRPHLRKSRALRKIKDIIARRPKQMK